ncbi:hypothetical protein cypCar_00032652 [Cyprinus carpio]|nr:hypothetical protein cypCar_00032652 [Cyprinus carpio]
MFDRFLFFLCLWRLVDAETTVSVTERDSLTLETGLTVWSSRRRETTYRSTVHVYGDLQDPVHYGNTETQVK